MKNNMEKKEIIEAIRVLTAILGVSIKSVDSKGRSFEETPFSETETQTIKRKILYLTEQL